jgi:hypothetical protein
MRIAYPACVAFGKWAAKSLAPWIIRTIQHGIRAWLKDDPVAAVRTGL